MSITDLNPSPVLGAIIIISVLLFLGVVGPGVVLLAKVYSQWKRMNYFLNAQMNQLKNMNHAIKEVRRQVATIQMGEQKILKARIRRDCNKIRLQGYRTPEQTEDCFEYMDAYEKLGGNGAVKHTFAHTMDTYPERDQGK